MREVGYTLVDLFPRFDCRQLACTNRFMWRMTD